MGRIDLKIDWCSHAAAKYAVEHWHYSRRMPAPKITHQGVWEDGGFIGAVIVGAGSNGNLGAPYGLTTFEVAELQRIALTDHATPVSRIIAIAIRRVVSANPGIRMVISYSDPFHGHHGGVYQAAGWYYLGETSLDMALRTPDGRMWHSRTFAKSGRKKHHGKYYSTPTSEDGEIIRLPAKHRYAKVIDDSLRTRIEAMSQPYPKRPKDSSEPPGDLPGEGGAAPTRTLQLR